MKKTNQSQKSDQAAEKLADLLAGTDPSLLDGVYDIDSPEKLAAYARVQTPNPAKSRRNAPLTRRPAFRTAVLSAGCLLLSASVLMAIPALLRSEDTVLPPKSTSASGSAFRGQFADTDGLDEPTAPDKTANFVPDINPPAIPTNPWQGQIGQVGEINSIDRVNYYSALWTLFGSSGASASALSAGKPAYGITRLSAHPDKAVTSETAAEAWTDTDTVGPAVNPSPTVPPDDDADIYYDEIDPEQTFTFTRVTLFQIQLTDETKFLASKLGTGVVDVVIAEGFIDPIITFKNGDRYFSCLLNGAGGSVLQFSTHKYIEGFNIVKNFEQENYEFRVSFFGDQVCYFECDDIFGNGTNPDGVLPVVSKSYVSNDPVSYTIAQLDQYFADGNLPDLPPVPPVQVGTVQPVPGTGTDTTTPITESGGSVLPPAIYELFPDAEKAYYADTYFVALYSDGSFLYGNALSSTFPKKGEYTRTRSGMYLRLNSDGQPVEEVYIPFQTDGGFLWKGRYYREGIRLDR